MNKALQNIGEVLGSAEDEPTKVMRFSPGRDPENTQLWRRMENVRYKTDGIREDIVVRGGTATYFIGGTIDGDIITEEAFEASFDGTAKDYLLLHTHSDHVYVYNETDDALKDYGDGHGFNPDTPLQVVHNGRFVYLFDYVTEVGRYIDLKKELLHKWLSYEPEEFKQFGFNLDGRSITTGDIEERNIWGFEEGGEAIVQIINQDEYTLVGGTPGISATGFLGRGVYEYIYKNGTYLVVDGEPIQRSKLLIITENTPASTDGSGEEFEINILVNPPIEGTTVDYKAELTNILKIGETLSVNNIRLESPWWRESSFPLALYIDPSVPGPNTPYNDHIILPALSDINLLTELEPSYRISDNLVLKNDAFKIPTLYRSYCYVYEFDDGSFSVPSQHSVFLVPADSMFNSNGELQLFGVSFKLPECPTNVVQVHLFSSRWQVNREKAVAPSDKYPNGPYFYCGAHQPDYASEFTIKDYTPDRDLVRPLNEFSTLDGGISSLFGSNQFTPRHVAAHKSGVLIGGYTIKRPRPSIASSYGFYKPKIYIRDYSADSVNDVYLQAAYEFSDGTLGPWVTCSTIIEDWEYIPKSTVEIHPESALVSAVHFYIRDERADPVEFRFIRRVSTMDDAYFGVPFTLGAIDDYPVQDLPEGSAENETVELDNYLAFGSPPQMVDIASQKPMEYGNRIEGLEVLAVDDDRADRVRYQLVIFTNDYPLVGYFDARIVDGGLVFQIDMERVGTPTGILSAESIFKQQGLLLYQGYEGIYAIGARGTELIISNDAYPQLEKPVRSAGYNAKENEVWFLLPGNECVVLDLDDRDVPRISEMKYPTENAKIMRQLGQLGDRLFGCADGTLLVLDEQVISDNGIAPGFQPVRGLLTSDYLAGMQRQLYLDVIELVGDGYAGQVYCDLQDARFDDGGGWTDDFTVSIDTGPYDLNMNGVLLDLAGRGVAPRIRIELEAANSGRFAGAELHYRPVEHEGAARF